MSDSRRSLAAIARASDRLCHLLWLFRQQEPEVVELIERRHSSGYAHYFTSRLGVLAEERWSDAVRIMPTSLVEHLLDRCHALGPRQYAVESVVAAGAALARLRPAAVPPALSQLSDRTRVAGELAGAWAALERPPDPHAAAIRDAMVLREERAHRHFEAAGDSGLTDLELTMLTVRWRGGDPRQLGRNFRWPEADVEQALARLSDLGLMGPGGNLTPEGQRMRDDLEEATDRGMAEALEGIADLPEAANSLVPLTEI